MTWECAKHHVDTFLTATETERPSITFMGGEPFIAFDLIKGCVAYIATTYPDTEICYTIVTNGTLVHGELQDWIVAHEDKVQVILSLDGLGEEHNLNRCQSLKNIDLDFFRQLRKPIVNTVFTLETSCKMADTTIQLHQLGFYVKGFIADGDLFKPLCSASPDWLL